MNLIINIDGREAIPIRAIPLISNWKLLHPESVALILARDEQYIEKNELVAYHRQDGTTHPVNPNLWGNCARKLKVLSNSIKATQIDHETGYQEWREKSLSVLPGGVFVWKDELCTYHYGRHGRYGVIQMNADGDRMTGSELEKLITLDFNPLVESAETQRLVLDGFEALQPSDALARVAATLAPVEAVEAVEAVEITSDGPPALTRNEIASSFAGLRGWDENRWKSKLSSPDDWLQACQRRRGTRGRGGFESTWWPVLIAAALVNRNDSTVRLLRARFKSQELLKPWLEVFETYYPDES